MSVKINEVVRFSKAWLCGVKPGDKLVSVNGNDIEDVLDYDFYMTTDDSDFFEIVIENKNGKLRTLKAKNTGGESPFGIKFETYLMDKQHSCRNGCIFCFVDQLPKGMRESLYFKDDDSRLSFLFGNYITLTNLSEHEIERIIKMHISPVNISVHTMNPELRVMMMKNKNAGECLKIIDRFAEADIQMNAQLVLCPGINDGKELEFTLSELGKLYPAVQSIAAVPVGITDHREGLFKLEPYTPETAGKTIDIIEKFGDEFLKEHGTRLAYPADEFYLKAGRPLPDEDFYENYPQYDNGVGMWTLFKTEFYNYVDTADLPQVTRHISCASGEAAFPLVCELCEYAMKKCPSLKIDVYKIVNDFFGHNITVTGLIVGRDLINQLKGKDLGETLIISSSMVKGTYPVKTDGVFLDDVTVKEAEDELGTEISTGKSDGETFAKLLWGVN